ncbi:hypothetical protein BHM03_00028133 [Ensete ventricosum]|uniref:Uncharacterized protein n=1 Tax=Ensete ventricosum TaxID=4639 RepID=A0A445MHX4_ENSVE|nr:hypothetical protein BHM03_00028133 [Ensete ventricosum]
MPKEHCLSALSASVSPPPGGIPSTPTTASPNPVFPTRANLVAFTTPTPKIPFFCPPRTDPAYVFLCSWREKYADQSVLLFVGKFLYRARISFSVFGLSDSVNRFLFFLKFIAMSNFSNFEPSSCSLLLICSLLLVCMFLYDIFWVFLSDRFFGANVMVSVTTQKASNPLHKVAASLNLPGLQLITKKLELPVKVVFPRNLFAGLVPGSSSTDYIMLGLGDMV